MNMVPSSISFWVFLWIAVAVAIFVSRWKRRNQSAGLVFAYLCNFTILHWIGGATYLRSWFGAGDPQMTRLGMIESTFAILAFAAGSLLVAPRVMRFLRTDQRAHQSHTPHRELPFAFLLVGLTAYVLSTTDLARLPSMSAVSAVSQQFIVVGIGLLCRNAWQRRQMEIVFACLGGSLLLPFLTIISQGFLGFGAMACFTILCFVSVMGRSLWRFAGASLVTAILFLSLYVSYMRDRGSIRDAVWGGQSISTRIDRVYSTISKLEFFDPFNDEHMRRIDARLNQNYLVGRAVEYLAAQDNYARGETILDAVIALVPRAVWPDKPVVAGSGNLVSRFTGIQFAQGTSVGIGQVMEWYVNFGRAGILIWFLLVGTFLTMIDTIAGTKLRNGDLLSFAKWYLPSLALLNIGGSLVEISATAGASLVVATLVDKIFLFRLQHRAKSLPRKPIQRQTMPVRVAQ